MIFFFLGWHLRKEVEELDDFTMLRDERDVFYGTFSCCYTRGGGTHLLILLGGMRKLFFPRTNTDLDEGFEFSSFTENDFKLGLIYSAG